MGIRRSFDRSPSPYFLTSASTNSYFLLGTQ